MNGGDKTDGLADAISIASEKGYVLYLDLDTISDKYNLSLGDFDWLCNELSLRGIILYDKAPLTKKEFDEDEYQDKSHLDYDEIYERIKQKCPSLTPFVNAVRRIIPPQYGEIQRLKYQIIEKNEYARKRMIEMHLRIALKLSLQRSEQFDHDISELIEIACLGLIRAIDKYNPDENGSIQSYISLWILQYFNRYQPLKRALVNYSTQKRDLYFMAYPSIKAYGCEGCDQLYRCKKIRNLLMEKNNWPFSTSDVAVEEATPDELFSQMFSEDYIEDEKWDSSLAGIAHSSIQTLDASFKKILNQELHNVLCSAMKNLSEKERYVVMARNGFFSDSEEMTLEAIGIKLGLSRERIRQIESKTYKKLKSLLLARRILPRHYT